MGTPHKHRDVIIAWANGEEIEVKTHDGRWLPLTKTNPDWEATDYRVKPKIVKREGWVNVYKIIGGYWVAGPYDTKEDADAANESMVFKIKRIDFAHIEWSDEEQI